MLVYVLHFYSQFSHAQVILSQQNEQVRLLILLYIYSVINSCQIKGEQLQTRTNLTRTNPTLQQVDGPNGSLPCPMPINSSTPPNYENLQLKATINSYFKKLNYPRDSFNLQNY